MGCILFFVFFYLHFFPALRCFERVDDGRVISLVPAGMFFCILDWGVQGLRKLWGPQEPKGMAVNAAARGRAGQLGRRREHRSSHDAPMQRLSMMMYSAKPV